MWRGFEQSLIDDAVDQWPTRLGAFDLVFRLMVDTLNIPCDYQFVFSVLDELYIPHHAWVRVHYQSMKCDVSFSQGSVSTLFS